MAKDIEKMLFPKKDILISDKKGNLSATIVDAELDGIECIFNYDGCVQLDTKGYSYITLTVDNLINLIKLIEKAEKKYDKMHKNDNSIEY